MKWSARLASSALAAALLIVCAPRTGAQQQPTFRSATALVQVDAVVLDHDGNFVQGLDAGDLALFEDGKPQKIEQFYQVTHDPVTRASMIAADAAGNPAEAAHRMFMIVFDEGNLSHESLMRVQQGAEAFIMTHIGPGDVGGVFVNGELYQGRVTTDKGALLAGVRSAKPAVENRQSLLAAFREFPRIPSESDALRISEGARELVQRLAADACRAEPTLCEIEGFSEGVQGKIENKARFYVRSARALTDRTIQTVSAISESLGRYAGRKTLVLLSEGFFSEDMRGTVERTAGRAARAGITIYSIDGRGMTPTTGTPDALSTGASRSTIFDTGEEGPAILTGGTGGFVVRNIDDMARAFNMVARDTSTYYVIGYSPTNASMNGKFRKIEVKSKIGGVTIRARKGYIASALPPQERLWK
jgi:VWFA-related protein